MDIQRSKYIHKMQDTINRFIDYVMDHGYPEHLNIINRDFRGYENCLRRAKIQAILTKYILEKYVDFYGNKSNLYFRGMGRSLVTAYLMFLALDEDIPEDFHYYVMPRMNGQNTFMSKEEYQEVLDLSDNVLYSVIDVLIHPDNPLKFNVDLNVDVYIRFDMDEENIHNLPVLDLSCDRDSVITILEETFMRVYKKYHNIPEDSEMPEISNKYEISECIPRYSAEHSIFYHDLAIAGYNYIFKGFSKSTRMSREFFDYIKSIGITHECIGYPDNNNLPTYTSEYHGFDKKFGSIGNIYDLHKIFPNGGKFFLDIIWTYSLQLIYMNYIKRLLDRSEPYMILCISRYSLDDFPEQYIYESREVCGIKRYSVYGTEEADLLYIHVLSNYSLGNIQEILDNIEMYSKQ